MFLFEDYFKEEDENKVEIINPKGLCMIDIYKVISSVDGIKEINMYNSYSFSDDGRKKIEVNVSVDKEINEILEKIMEKLSSYDIEIKNISERKGEDKNILFCLNKKFATERLDAIKNVSPAQSQENNGVLRILKLGEL